jgi:hypothetical protein
MASRWWVGWLVAVLAMPVSACSELEQMLPALERLAEDLDEGALGELVDDAAGRVTNGTPVRITAEVEAGFQQWGHGVDLWAWSGSWNHVVNGRLGPDGAWLQVSEDVDAAHGSGYEICYYQEETGDFVTEWDSELLFPGTSHPAVGVTADGNDVLFLYEVPLETMFVHPGSPACGPGSPVESGSLEAALYYMYVLDGERAPGAETSTIPGIIDGVTVTRIPLDELLDGTTHTTTATFGGTWEEDPDALEGTLRVTLTVTSE